MTGGKKMPQKFGDGALNSTGTSDPSCDICGGRTTFASTFVAVFGFSTTTFVPSDSPSLRISMPPLALTVWV